jgi:HD-GYP domain-containing protein (c-di-GMP phosphodiesterase class II)
LSDEEYEEVKKHPLKGAQILSAVSMFKSVVPIVQCHHERIDGKGYPQGLSGTQIPLMSRIISVVDAFDAMTSDRQYRTRMEFDRARKQLVLGKGTQFDNDIVDVFIHLLENYTEMLDEMNASHIGTDSYQLIVG